MAGQQGVTIKVSLAGAATARREANSTGKAIKGIGTESGTTARKVHLAELSMKGFEKTSHKLRHTIKELAGVTGLAGLAFGTGEIVKSAIEAQNSQVKLQQTLKNSGLSWRRYGKEIEEATDRTSIRTGFSPAQITESLSNLIRTTGNVGKAQKLNNTVLDLARTKNLGLAGASSLLARVYNGNYRGLNRLGIAITPVTVAQDKLKASGQKYTAAQIARAKADDKAATATQALKIVQQKFAGQAGAYAQHTLQGQVDRLKASLEVAQEKLGLVVLPYMIRGVGKLTELMKKLIEKWPQISKTISRDADKVKAKLSPLLDFISHHRKGVREFGLALLGIGVGLKAIKAVGHFTGLSKVASIATGKSGLGRLVSKYGGATPVYVVNWGGKLEKTSLPKKALGAAKKLAPGAAGIGTSLLGDAGALGAGAAGGVFAFGAAGAYGLTKVPGISGFYKSLGNGGSRDSWLNHPGGWFGGSSYKPPMTTPGLYQQGGIPYFSPVSAAAVTAPYTPSVAGNMVLGRGGSPFVVESHTTLQVDGKTLARAVTRAAHKQAALK